MNNKEYLEQISADARPLKAKHSLFGITLSPKTIKILLISLAAIVVVLIAGSILSSSSKPINSEQDVLTQINLRSDELMKTISTFNPRVKSSNLRSMSNSLNAVLAGLSYNVTSYIINVLGEKPPKSSIQEQEQTLIDELNDTLETARITGVMDRTYVREFTYQISLLQALISEAEEKTENGELKSVLESTMSDLEQLHTQFNDFSAR